MYKEILIPIDLNDEASWSKALPVVIELNKAFGCKVHVMTVVPSMGMPWVSSFFPEGFEQKALEATNEALHAWTKQHLSAIDGVQHIVAHGTVYQEILDTAETLSPALDLIVMAAHRPELEDYLIGPNASRVVRHAGISVLIVRD